MSNNYSAWIIKCSECKSIGVFWAKPGHYVKMKYFIRPTIYRIFCPKCGNEWDSKDSKIELTTTVPNGCLVTYNEQQI